MLELEGGRLWIGKDGEYMEKADARSSEEYAVVEYGSSKTIEEAEARSARSRLIETKGAIWSLKQKERKHRNGIHDGNQIQN